MIAFEALLQIVRVEEAELRHWIESGWVLPEGDSGAWIFREVDVARARLIAEIRHDLAIDDGALPVVLSLLDQLYGLRRELQALYGAVAAQPSSVRDAISAAISDSERTQR